MGRLFFTLKIIILSPIVIVFTGILLTVICCRTPKTVSVITEYSPEQKALWQKQKGSINEINRLFAENNQYYFTDIQRDTIKPDNIFRIAVIGDSWIWGDGIYYKYTWSHLLEDKILEKYKNTELISWGLCGWSTLHEYRYFINNGFRYHSDLLIVGVVENDPSLSYDDQPAEFKKWQEGLYSDFNLKGYENLILDFVDSVNSNGTEILFVLTPLSADSTRMRWNNKIVDIMTRNNLNYLNLYPAFANKFKGLPPEVLFASPVNGHPGLRLNKFFANEVFNYLKRNNYLIKKVS